MKLINITNEMEIKPGQIVKTSRYEPFKVSEIVGKPPDQPGSTGRIYVEEIDSPQKTWTNEYFPSVFNCKWVEE